MRTQRINSRLSERQLFPQGKSWAIQLIAASHEARLATKAGSPDKPTMPNELGSFGIWL